jgi:hypothetical protein
MSIETIFKIKKIAMSRKLIFLCVLTSLIPQLSAQEIIGDKYFNWSFNISSNLLLSGPSSSLKNIMLKSGLMNGPTSIKSRMPFRFEAARYINNNISVGINVGSSFLVKTDTWSFNRANIDFKTNTISTNILYNYRNFLFLGGGPSINFISIYIPSNLGYSRYCKIGMGALASIEFPRKTKIYAKLNLQYNLVGRVDLGKIYLGQHRGSYYSEINGNNLSMNYLQLSFGFGIRI